MKRKGRKTSGERRSELEESELKAWENFKRRLSAINGVAQALELSMSTRGESFPGRQYYSNFAFFMQNAFAIPGGSNSEERELYRELLERLEAGGSVKEGTADRIFGGDSGRGDES